MGVFIETKHLKSLSGTLVISNNVCTIQQLSDSTATLTEWVIPILHCGVSNVELAVELTPIFVDLVGRSEIVHITDDYACFGNVSITYKKGDIVSWGTRLPELAAIVKIPEVTVENDTVELSIHDNLLNFRMNDMTLHQNVFHAFKEFEGITVDLGILKDILNKHIGCMCKLYIENDFPVCLEFIDPTQLTVRYYVAPICVDEV